MVVIDVDILLANLLKFPVARVGVDGTIPVLGVLENPLSVSLLCVRVSRGSIKNPLGETLPGIAVAKIPSQNGTVASSDKGNISPSDIVLVPADLEPRAKRLSLSIQHGRVNTTHNATLKFVGKGDELSLASLNPDVLPGDAVASVVVDVEASPVIASVGNGDTTAAIVIIAPCKNRLSVVIASPSICSTITLLVVLVSRDGLAVKAASLVALKARLRLGHNLSDIRHGLAYWCLVRTSRDTGSARGSCSGHGSGNAEECEKRQTNHCFREWANCG